MRRLLCCALLSLVLAAPAWALVTALTPLSQLLDNATLIFTATVTELDAERPSMVLTIDRKLKGKPDFDTLGVLLEGDKGAKKRKEPAKVLERLDKKLTLVAFVFHDADADPPYTARVYTNGTWLTMTGTKVDKEVRWSFVNLEPYLRRTYKGTTEEMIRTVEDALAKKKDPPKPDEKEKEGLGPPVEKAKKCDEDEPQLGVVPTVLVGGPLVLLAMLFPAAFGGWKRWLVLLSTAGTNSTLYTIQWWFGPQLTGTWLGSDAALWAAMGVVNVLGLAWAYNRHLALVQAGAAPGRPGAAEVIVLAVVSALSAAGVAALMAFDQPVFSKEWLPALGFAFAFWVGLAYVVWARLRPPSMTPALATEAVVLAGLAVGSIALGTQAQVTGRPESGEGVKVAWKFRPRDPGGILSSPLAHGGKLYVAGAHANGFTSWGTVYCLDQSDGRELWRFPPPKSRVRLKQVFSSPAIADGKLYIGEGFHEDFDCKLYCLDATSGELLWQFETGSHTESTPTVADGRVYFGAGDDGLYCVGAADKRELWRFPNFHIDAQPRVAGGRVYAGCGVGDEFKQTGVSCLDAGDKGRPLWRAETDLPVWGRPAVTGGFVFAGCGNGRVNQAAEKPAGEVLCLRDTDGGVVWRQKFPEGVLGSLVADGGNLYFGCRDKRLYCLAAEDGSRAWRRDMGSPVVMTPALEGGRLYAGAFAGYFVCVEPATNELVWARDMASLANSPVELIGTPAVASGEGLRRVFVGLTLVGASRVGEVVCLEERDKAE